MKTKQSVSVMIALVAVMAVAIPPMAFAVEGETEDSMAHPESMKQKNGKAIRDLPELEFSDESVPRDETISENLEKEVISITDAIASIEGRVLQIGLKPIQGYMVYQAKVFSNDLITHVIVDAGNGDILYTSEGKTLEEIEELHAERKEVRTEKKLGKIDNKIDRLEDRISQPSGNDELDALRQQFVDKLMELREAISSDDADSIQTLKDELKDLRDQINEMRR